MLRQMLISGRFLMVLPVIGSLLLTVGVVIMGVGVLVERTWSFIQKGEFSLKAAKMMSYTVIQTLDFFLVGALGYITAIGLYNLFISNDDRQLLKRIKIEKLKDLEDKIFGVVVAALAVSFLGQLSDAGSMEDVYHAGISIALVIGSLCMFMYVSGKTETPHHSQ